MNLIQTDDFNLAKWTSLLKGWPSINIERWPGLALQCEHIQKQLDAMVPEKSRLVRHIALPVIRSVAAHSKARFEMPLGQAVQTVVFQPDLSRPVQEADFCTIDQMQDWTIALVEQMKEHCIIMGVNLETAKTLWFNRFSQFDRLWVEVFATEG